MLDWLSDGAQLAMIESVILASGVGIAAPRLGFIILFGTGIGLVVNAYLAGALWFA